MNAKEFLYISGNDSSKGNDLLNDFPREERILISRLSAIHGPAIIMKNSKSGTEIRLADPELLKSDGIQELYKKHLYVNVTKVINDNNYNACLCFKGMRTYSIDELLAYPPLDKRGIKLDSVKIFVSDSSKNMDKDSDGNLIPKKIGIDLKPINSLDDDHIAIKYLISRGYDKNELYDQFGALWCENGNPDCVYGKLPMGMLKSPAGRIVFPVTQFGKYRGWQARLIEKIENDKLYVYCGINKKWNHVADIRDGKRYALNKYCMSILSSKYIIGAGTSSSDNMLGIDSAIKWKNDNWESVVGIVEGVLDAARLGPPFCSVFGVNISEHNANFIKSLFSKVVYCVDHDEAGKKLKSNLERRFYGSGIDLIEMEYPKEYKDVGDMPSSVALEIKKGVFDKICN